MVRTKKIKEDVVVVEEEIIKEDVVVENLEEKRDGKGKVEILTQNGKPYKKVTWIKGVPTVEYL